LLQHRRDVRSGAGSLLGCGQLLGASKVKNSVVFDVYRVHVTGLEVLPGQKAEAIEDRALRPALDLTSEGEVCDAETEADRVGGKEGEVLIGDEPALEAPIYPRRAPAIEVHERDAEVPGSLVAKRVQAADLGMELRELWLERAGGATFLHRDDCLVAVATRTGQSNDADRAEE
jgi:hypothetical protein